VNLTKGSPQVFKTAHHPDFKRDHRLRVVDVALATSAAPAFFPIAEIEDELFVDGGLYANCPDLIGLHEAEHFFGVASDRVRMLSVGTTSTFFSVSHTIGRRLGIFGWYNRLPQTAMSSQQLSAVNITTHRLGDRYIRIDAVQSSEQERDLSFDVATAEACRTLRALAAAAYQDSIGRAGVLEILSREAPEPTFFYPQ